MDLLISIPIRPHLKKFMQFFTEVDPYRISHKDPFGRVIFAELKKPSAYYKQFRKKEGFKSFSDNLDIVIPYDLWQRRYRFLVSEDTVKNIDSFLHHLFKSNFRLTLLFHEKVHSRKKRDKIKAYMRLLKLNEDDYEVDTLKKDFYRFSKKIKG